MEATITLEYIDEKTARAIAKAVAPENSETLEGLYIETFRNNNKVVTEIKAEVKFATFIATIDDLLFSASAAGKTICLAKKGEKATSKQI